MTSFFALRVSDVDAARKARPPVDVAKLDAERRKWWNGVLRYRDREWGYVHLQRTKPHTVIDDGGHFPGIENPEVLAHDIAEFFRSIA